MTSPCWTGACWRLMLGVGALVAAAAPAVALPHPVVATTCVTTPPVTSRCELWANSYSAPQYGATNITRPLAIAASPTSDLVYETGAAVVGSSANESYTTVAYHKSTGAIAWSSLFYGPDGGDAESLAIAVSPDGSSVFVTGRDDFIGASWRLGTVAYDAITGQQRWAQTLQVGAAAAGTAIGVSGDGSRVYVGGASFTDNAATNYGFITLAYSASSGQQLWQGRYIGAAHNSDGINALSVDPISDRVFVSGHSQGTGTGDDYATVAYAGATGQELWASRWTGGSTAESLPRASAVSPDGSAVVVTGYSNEGSTSSSDIVTVSWNAATGAQRWVAHYASPNVGYDIGTGVAVSPDSTEVFVVGQVPGPYNSVSINECDCDFATVAYDASSGQQRWLTAYGTDYVYTTGEVSQGATGVAVSPNGASVYVTGVAYNGGVSSITATVSYDPVSGSQQWVARYAPTAAPTDGAVPTQVVVDPISGDAFVAALFDHYITDTQGNTNTYYEYGVIAYAGSGGSEAVVPDAPAATLLAGSALLGTAVLVGRRRHTRRKRGLGALPISDWPAMTPPAR